MGKFLRILGVCVGFSGLVCVYGSLGTPDRNDENQLIPILAQVAEDQETVDTLRANSEEVQTARGQERELRWKALALLIETFDGAELEDRVRNLDEEKQNKVRTTLDESLDSEVRFAELQWRAHTERVESLERRGACLAIVGKVARKDEVAQMIRGHVREANDAESYFRGVEAVRMEVKSMIARADSIRAKLRNEEDNERAFDEARIRLGSGREQVDDWVRTLLQPMLERKRQSDEELRAALSEVINQLVPLVERGIRREETILADRFQAVYDALKPEMSDRGGSILAGAIDQTLWERGENQGMDRSLNRGLGRILIPDQAREKEHRLKELIYGADEEQSDEDRRIEMKDILDGPNLDRNWQDTEGRTLLMHATTVVDEETIGKLLQSGDIDLTITDDEGMTALNIANMNEQTRIIELLKNSIN